MNVFRVAALISVLGLSLSVSAEDVVPATAEAGDDVRASLNRRDRLRQYFGNRATPDWLVSAREREQAFLDKLGLDLIVAYDALGQAVLGGGDEPTAGSGELSLIGNWTLGGRKHDRPFDLHYRIRTRDAYGDRAPPSLADEIGALWGTVDGFSDAGFQVPDFHFRQTFIRRNLELRYGQLSADSQLDSHALRGSKQTFLNRAFSSNPAVAFPRFGAGATAQWKPPSGLDLTAVVTTVQATRAGDQVDFNLDSSDLFEAVQVGSSFTGLGDDPARAQLMLWHADAIEEEDLPSGYGASLTVEQAFPASKLKSFLRYAWANDQSTDLAHLLAGGLALPHRTVDQYGVALGAGRSSDETGDWQGVLETFYRWQISPEFHLSPSLQLVTGEGLAEDRDLRVLPALRAHVSF